MQHSIYQNEEDQVRSEAKADNKNFLEKERSVLCSNWELQETKKKIDKNSFYATLYLQFLDDAGSI